MCGLAGYFSLSGDVDSRIKMRCALSKLSSRGPDGEQQKLFSLNSGSLCLGHRRLAIIDLSKQGLQPMRSSCGRYWIVFNGEIYNYREIRNELSACGVSFQSETDTEVLLEAYIRWGEAILPRLIGMFAFSIFDSEAQILNCYRDPFGIKPFFYSKGDNYFAFASQIDALLELTGTPPRPNFQRGFDYLSLGRYDDQSDTFFDGIFRLEPGCYIRINLALNSELSLGRWWKPQITERQNVTFNDAVELVRAEFIKSVQLHLRSDVSLGAALSGGVDSSALIGAIRHLEPDLDIHTFSYVASDGAASEEKWVDIVNDAVKAIPHKINIQTDELFADLDDMIVAQGEPFSSTSIYASYRVYKMVRESCISVCLDGQGADEMFAGYHGFPHLRLRSLMEEGRLGEMRRFLSNWAEWPGRDKKVTLQRFAAQFLPLSLHTVGRKIIGRKIVPPWLNSVTLKRAGVKLKPYRYGHSHKDGWRRRVIEHERFQLGYGGLEHLLRQGDRNSMRFSVESRLPFLTTPLAELSLALPEDYKISSSGETKSVLRAALRGLVPDEILNRRDKVGFETPENQWLRSDKMDLDSILEPAAELGIFKMDCLAKDLRDVRNNALTISHEKWRIVNYCKWAGLFVRNY